MASIGDMPKVSDPVSKVPMIFLSICHLLKTSYQVKLSRSGTALLSGLSHGIHSQRWFLKAIKSVLLGADMRWTMSSLHYSLDYVRGTL